MGANRLKDESSAYLKQHKDNPVHWWPYGPEAIQKAADEKKPIFLSIGYSSCHWCHVMAEESFEDRVTADFLNEHFINIKVDREELPDIDQYYQIACQVMNGRGGWPLSVFLTPQMKPYFVGTYFPKVGAEGSPSFMEVIRNLKIAFYDDRQTVDTNANQIVEAITQAPRVEQKVEFEGHYPQAASILNAIKNHQDNENGGYGEAPKFPHFSFLEWSVEHMLEGMVPEEFGKHIVETVEKMLMGGIFDHARGGIHRYSVDKNWTVPHFEKMLYDQAGLLRLLSKISLVYPSPLVFDALIQTLEYLRVEMLSEDGYFFSAQDADSEGMEGLFFTFSKDEFIDALVQFNEELSENMETYLKWFNITEKGNFERNLNVISLNHEHKEEFYSPEGWNKIREIRQALLEDRKGRVPPATDSKGVASWNFQIISALVDVVQYCKIEAITQSATQLLTSTINTIHKTFIRPSDEDGKSRILSTTTRDGHVPLFEDYVMFAESQLRFYEISGQDSFKQTGLNTLEFIFNEFFEDEKFYTRSIKHHDSQLYANIHVPIFDQSYKSPLSVLFGLIRKWQTSTNLMAQLEKSKNSREVLTHLSLQNPLMFGETLRALVYPDEAYRKIDIPLSWLKENKFGKYYPHFSARFAINFHEEENWQICTYKECELAGNSLDEFDKIFSAPAEGQE